MNISTSENNDAQTVTTFNGVGALALADVNFRLIGNLL